MGKPKRTFNAFAIQFKRGRASGHTHQKIIAAIVTALKDHGRLWYDHILLPAVPISLSPTPVKIPHMSPNPDVVILTQFGKEEMFMIQVQRVYPIKTPGGDYPHNIKPKRRSK